MARERRRPVPIGGRGGAIIAIAVLGVLAFRGLGLSAGELLPREGNHELGAFFSRALHPALDHETDFHPKQSLVSMSLEAAALTIGIAGAAMGLALVLGAVLGFFASTAWWAGELSGGRGPLGRALARAFLPGVYVATRALIAFMRSVHELLWAVLFLVVFGLTETTAIVAIAIPYGGTLAKIFSEMIDEAPRGPASALRAGGGSGVQIFALGLLPSALPDMIAYTFYRFECALRSSAILGFFGLSTLGVLIKDSFSYNYYGETWLHLYVLIAMVVLFDSWSGAIRRRMVG